MAGAPPPPRVIGIDDFAWRRGHSYGSIIVDFERRQVIDSWPTGSATPWSHGFVVTRRSRSSAGIAVPAMALQPPKRHRKHGRSPIAGHLFENASAAFLAAVRSEMPGLRRALAPTGPIDPATLTRAERIQWDGGPQLKEQGLTLLSMHLRGGIMETIVE